MPLSYKRRCLLLNTGQGKKKSHISIFGPLTIISDRDADIRRREERVLPSIAHVLQTFLQRLRKGQSSIHGQVELQKVHPSERTGQLATAPVKKSLRETDSIPAVVPAVREPHTGPYRAIVMRRRRPAQRYRELDAMLEELKRDRLMDTDTVMVPVPAHNLARQLHRSLEQEK